MENTQEEFVPTPVSKRRASDGPSDPLPFPTERDRLQLLLELTSALAFNTDPRDLVTALSSTLRRVIPHEFMGLALHENESDALVLQAAALRLPNGHQNGHHTRRRLPLINSPSGRAFRARRTLVFHDDELTRFGEVVAPLRQCGIRALCCVPLAVRDLALGTLEIGSCEPDAFTPAAVAVIDVVGHHVAMAVGNGLAFHEIVQRDDNPAGEQISPQGQIPAEEPFEGIVGGSRPLRDVLQQVEIVAQTDSTVLVLGETGTGKELIARAIHNRSARRGRAFVKINCAAIPSGLLESELFGHERGAFTGAVAQKIGRFEEANGGTLFLDEVGEIPLELQPKLLRVLQDQEFVRVGGTRTIKVDVRLVAATNRDLAQMVEQHGFRDDLYYRLNVFPIRVPSLRERPDDIEPLVRHFVQRFAARMQRRIEAIPTETLELMRRYPWPGNIRELENLVERAVILSVGPRLMIPLEHLIRRSSSLAQDDDALELVKRAHIVRVLEKTNWIVGGPRGAAARLGMKRTTLQSFMKRYAIARSGGCSGGADRARRPISDMAS
jgi:formate hydrogenlyase transcriptional activator